MNRYQGQLYAKDQQGQKFPLNRNILQLMPQRDIIDYLKKISIFAPEGTRLLLKHKNEEEDIEIHIGSTGIYEIEDIQIVSLKFLDNSSSEIIIDYILFIKI